MLLPQLGMLIPVVSGVAVRHLHETHSPLRQTPGQQALAPILVGGLHSDAVEIQGALRLPGEIQGFGGVALHAKGQLEGLDAGFQPGIVGCRVEMPPVPGPHQVELPALHPRVPSLGLQVGYFPLDELGGAVADSSALVDRGQKSRPEVLAPTMDVGG